MESCFQMLGKILWSAKFTVKASWRTLSDMQSLGRMLPTYFSGNDDSNTCCNRLENDPKECGKKSVKRMKENCGVPKAQET